MVGEPVDGTHGESSGGDRGFVVEDLDVSEAAVVIDGSMDVSVAHLAWSRNRLMPVRLSGEVRV